MIIRGHSIPNELAEKIAEVLRSLNWSWGRGNVTEVTFLSTSDDGKMTGVITRRIPTTQITGYTEERKFTVVNNTVFFLSHQHKIL